MADVIRLTLHQAAVVKESLRLAAAAPGRLPRAVPPTGSGAAPLTVDGQLIPPGVRHYASQHRSMRCDLGLT